MMMNIHICVFFKWRATSYKLAKSFFFDVEVGAMAPLVPMCEKFSNAHPLVKVGIVGTMKKWMKGKYKNGERKTC